MLAVVLTAVITAAFFQGATADHKMQVAAAIERERAMARKDKEADLARREAGFAEVQAIRAQLEQMPVERQRDEAKKLFDAVREKYEDLGAEPRRWTDLAWMQSEYKRRNEAIDLIAKQVMENRQQLMEAQQELKAAESKVIIDAIKLKVWVAEQTKPKVPAGLPQGMERSQKTE